MWAPFQSKKISAEFEEETPLSVKGSCCVIQIWGYEGGGNQLSTDGAAAAPERASIFCGSIAQ